MTICNVLNIVKSNGATADYGCSLFDPSGSYIHLKVWLGMKRKNVRVFLSDVTKFSVECHGTFVESQGFVMAVLRALWLQRISQTA